MAKPLLVVDIDDVLADYANPFLKFLQTQGIILSRADIKGSFTQTQIPPDLFIAFARKGYLRKLQTIEGSEIAINKLSQSFMLLALTARPKCAGIDTSDWLDKYFSEINDVVFSANKGEFCKSVEAWGLIEDQTRYASQFPNSFIIAAPWNESWKGFRGNWEQVTAEILRKLYADRRDLNKNF